MCHHDTTSAGEVISIRRLKHTVIASIALAGRSNPWLEIATSLRSSQ